MVNCEVVLIGAENTFVVIATIYFGTKVLANSGSFESWFACKAFIHYRQFSIEKYVQQFKLARLWGLH